MEPESDMPGMQPETWKRYIKGNFRPRRGQRDLFRIAAGLTTKGDAPNIVRAVLPTGYGKTLAGLGSYLILRTQGAVNRLLVLVPNDELRRQWSEDAGENAEALGGAISGSVQLENPAAAFRAVNDGKVEIVVASYPQAVYDSRSWINELLSKGHWMVIYDEFHHLAEEKAWGINAGRIIRDNLCRIALMLSATPIRTDKRTTIGGGLAKEGEGLVFKPDVCVTLEQALSEEAIRKPKAHIHHYFVDVMADGDSEPTRVTTEMLREADVTDFSKYEARRKLRYVQRYLSEIIVDTVNIYETKNAQHLGQHQVLGFAMTCNHAEFVAQQFNSITGIGFADWIGVTRDDATNNAILTRYKDGKLPCLIQVDKAGEGFNNKRCSILVFLNLIRSGAKLTQQVGRGLRRNYDIPFKEDSCQVLASADTELAEYISKLEIELKTEESTSGDGDDVDRWPLFRDLLSVEAEHDRVELISHGSHDAEMETILAMAKEDGAPPELEQMNVEWLRRFFRRMRGSSKTGDAPKSFADETAKRDHYSGEVERILKTFVRKAVELYSKQQGKEFDPQLLGVAKRAVHLRWNQVKKQNHNGMGGDEFRSKYYWVRDEYEKMRTLREIPSWLSLSSNLPF